MLIDFDFGLSQLSGNEALLIKLLGKIGAEYADCEERLNGMFESHNWSDAKVLIHTLKGVSGNMGCTGLHKACKLVDEELKYADAIPASLPTLYTTLTDTLEAISAVVDSGSIAQGAAPTERNQDAENSSKTELKDLLTSNAFITPDTLAQHLANINLTTADKQQLEHCINTLDYKSALALLDS